MSSNRVNYIYKRGPSRKGHGLGGFFKGWLNKTIPIIKAKVGPTAKRLGKDVAVQALDSVYSAGRDMLLSNEDRPAYNQVDDGNFKYTTPVNIRRPPKKAIKRKARSKPVSRIRNAKRKRPNSDLAVFRKVTL